MAKDRNKDGQFEPGNQVRTGTGNLRTVTMARKAGTFAQFLRAVGDQWADNDKKYTYWQTVALKAFELAAKGDKDARNWVTDRAFGKATDGVSVDPQSFVEKMLLKYGTSASELENDPVAGELLKLLGIEPSADRLIGETSQGLESERRFGEGDEVPDAD